MSPKAHKPRVVLFGGAGYLGSVLIGRLLDFGYAVQVVDSLRFGDIGVVPYRDRSDFEVTEADIGDIPQVTLAVKGAQAVILLASLVGEPACDRDPRETVDINYLATKSLAETCRYYEVPRFIFASTDSAYGIQEGTMYEDSPMDPISLYGRLKVKAEREIMSLKNGSFKPTVLRMATIYGLSPRMRFDLVVNVLTLNAFVNGKIMIHGGAQWRPLVHVADAAKAYAMCLQAPLEDVGGEVFNVGSNEQNYQIRQLADQVAEVFPNVDVDTVPQSPDLRDYYVSFDKISSVLGYRVEHSVTDGIREIKQALEDGEIADHSHPRHYNVGSVAR